MSPASRPAPRRPLACWCALVACVLAAVAARPALGTPPRGSEAPAIALKDLDGKPLTTKDFGDRPYVLIFGEFSHEGAKKACADVLDVLADPRVGRDAATAVLVIAEDAPESKLKEEAATGRFPALVLRDSKRETFSAYHVLVIPTIVVVDAKGKVVYATPGFVQRFKELLGEAILVATGREASEQFEKSLDPKNPAPSAEETRAARLVHLGDELVRHGMLDTAEARYGEALTLEPKSTPARLGLGGLMLRQDRATDAEPFFRSVLSDEPQNVDAILGLAMVDIKKGGDHVNDGEAAAKRALERTPNSAKAHYVLGRAHEARGDAGKAAEEYRKAAELLMDR